MQAEFACAAADPVPGGSPAPPATNLTAEKAQAGKILLALVGDFGMHAGGKEDSRSRAYVTEGGLTIFSPKSMKAKISPF